MLDSVLGIVNFQLYVLSVIDCWYSGASRHFRSALLGVQ